MSLGIAGPHGRFLIRILAGIFIFYSGVSIFYRPSYEVLYTTSYVDAGCLESGCIRSYLLEIGNTGWNDQDFITVEVKNHWLESAVLPPKAALFGKVPRPMQVEIKGENAKWILGGLKSGKRLNISFVLSLKGGIDLPAWDDILIEVQPGAGFAHKGHPEWTTFSRFLAAIF